MHVYQHACTYIAGQYIGFSGGGGEGVMCLLKVYTFSNTVPLINPLVAPPPRAEVVYVVARLPEMDTILHAFRNQITIHYT